MAVPLFFVIISKFGIILNYSSETCVIKLWLFYKTSTINYRTMAKYDLTQKELPAHKDPLELPAHKIKGVISRKSSAAAVPPVAAVSTADVDEAKGTFRWELLAALLGVALVFAGFLFWGKHDSMKDTSTLTSGVMKTDANPVGFMSDGVASARITDETDLGTAADLANNSGEINAEVEEVDVAPVTSAATGATDMSGALAGSGSSATGISTDKVIYLFKFDSEGVRENTPLNNLAEKAKSESKDVTVVAYTDEKGNEAYNLRLSRERAEAIGDYLIAHGVPADHVTTIGKGETHAFGNDALDRRAIITIN